MTDNKKPVMTFRSGPVGRAGLSLSVWAKDTWGYSIAIRKSYKDKAGLWMETKYLDGTDMVLLAFLSNQAAQWIASQGQAKEETQATVDLTDAVTSDDLPF